jgi:FMN phosphatase YigB (HAD superfamily)/DNA-binding XRE family transcriptional regulator
MAMSGVGNGVKTTEEKRLGQVIQSARRNVGLTQQSLCQKSGLSYSTLAKIERDAIKSPSIFTIQDIAETLGLSLDQLMQSVPRRVIPPKPHKKVSSAGIRFVFFDMNGCLIRYKYSIAAKLAEDAGSTSDVVESIVGRYDDDINKGTVSMDEFNTALAERLHVMVDWNKYYLDAIEAVPHMDELVTWVAENYKIGILTNTVPGVVGPMLETGTLPRIDYDTIVESCQVGALKPDERMYEIATELAGVPPEQILLIDDNKGNTNAASKYGWNVILFNVLHPEETIVNISNALQPAN